MRIVRGAGCRPRRGAWNGPDGTFNAHQASRLETVTARRLLSGWGRTAPSAAAVHSPLSTDDIAAELAGAPARGVIARGLGRSYGDVAQNAGGLVLDLTGMNRILAFDEAEGIVTCEGGCSLADLIARCLPAGWFLPVVPGTRYVTAGGAVANDVHGKNHHRDGSFGEHVLSLTLLTPAGELRELDPARTPQEFRATVGGLGLTGVIVEVTLRLVPVETGVMRVTTERAPTLEHALDRLTATDHLHRYSVAWLDCAIAGRGFGRALLLRGDHATRAELPADRQSEALAPPSERGIGVPPWASLAPLIRPATVAAFNELYFKAAREDEGALQALGPFFFPLDAVRNWNRIYGRSGFLQYQFVVPFGAENALLELVRLVSSGPRPAALVVLKRFGGSEGLLSFPQPGWTVAIDIPLPAAGLGPLLDVADDIVASTGGRVYLAKDSRLRRDRLRAMYPQLAEWEETRAALDPDGRMRSDLARRLGVGRQVRARTR